MENVLQYITLYAPIVFAILGEIGVVVGLIAKIKSYFEKANAAVAELKQSTEYKQLKNQMTIVIEENIELKKQLRIVMEKLTHVKVQDESISNNEQI